MPSAAQSLGPRGASKTIAKDLVAGKTTKSAPAPSETRMDELIQKFGTDTTFRA